MLCEWLTLITAFLLGNVAIIMFCRGSKNETDV